jgi:hypothetical protein
MPSPPAKSQTNCVERRNRDEMGLRLFQYRQLKETMQAGYGFERHREWKTCCGNKGEKSKMEDRAAEDFPAESRSIPSCAGGNGIIRNENEFSVRTGTDVKRDGSR